MKKKQDRPQKRILYRILAWLVAPFFRLIFRYSYKKERLNGPTLVIANHVTNYDPIFLGMAFPKDPMHFVASEHLFRLGFLSKLLRFVFDPIARRKGTTGADTAMACTRKLREGRSVCLFAEGECSWDGLTADIFPATGRLARMGNCTLITFRLEGGYLTAPRWGKGVRKGKMTGRIVGIYTPEDLKALDKDAITGLIQRDIFENTWENQEKNPIRYKSRHRAENLQTVLYACPHCKTIGNLSSKGAYLSCTCGAKWEYTEFGTFAPAEPFANMAQWDAWQKTLLTDAVDQGTLQLRDEGMVLSDILDDHKQKIIARGAMTLENGILRCGDVEFPLDKIDDMALIQSRTLLISSGTRYCQLKADDPCCLRKYLAAWKHTIRQRDAVNAG